MPRYKIHSLSCPVPSIVTWWWQHHAVGILLLSSDREANRMMDDAKYRATLEENLRLQKT